MIILKMESNTKFDDGPGSLHSYLHSEDIPIQRSDELSSTSQSNHLQISQSPTRDFITVKSANHCNFPDKQEDCVDANFQIESPVCTSICQVPGPFSDTIGEKICTQHVNQSRTERKKEMLVSKEKNNNEQAKMKKSTEDLNILPNAPSCPVPEQSNPVYNTLSVHSTSGPIPTPIIDIPSDSVFYSFVILHVPEDQEEASRVCGVLQEIVIGEGTTFCEGFETPGVSLLSSFEEAVENSAYVVLLLTNSFLSEWGKFQTHAVLMNSIEDGNKSGSVIPFHPTLNYILRKLPLCLRSLSPLKEDSPTFRQKARKTFKENVINMEREQWKRKQFAIWLEKHGKKNSVQNVSLEHNTICNQLCAGMLHINILQSLPMQPIAFHLNNVDNVQIGNQNIMNVQDPGNEPSIDMYGEGFEEDELEA